MANTIYSAMVTRPRLAQNSISVFSFVNIGLPYEGVAYCAGSAAPFEAMVTGDSLAELEHPTRATPACSRGTSNLRSTTCSCSLQLKVWIPSWPGHQLGRILSAGDSR